MLLCQVVMTLRHLRILPGSLYEVSSIGQLNSHTINDNETFFHEIILLPFNTQIIALLYIVSQRRIDFYSIKSNSLNRTTKMF